MSKRKSNIYLRKDGRWEGRMHISGTQKYKSVYGKTYTQAKDKLHKLCLENSTPTQLCSLFFNDVFEKWLTAQALKIKESSYANYKFKFEKHISPFFKGIKYTKVSEKTLNYFLNEKAKSNLSSKYIIDMLVLIKSAAKWAETNHNFENKISDFTLPKQKKSEHILLNKEQKKVLQNQLLKANSKRCAGILLAMFTGLRIGELCGLKWEDVDFDEKKLFVRRTVQRITVSGELRKTAVRITSPKSETSIRVIPLPCFLIKLLKTFKDNGDFFILSGDCKPVEPRCMAYFFKSVLKKLNLPNVKFHSLRHSFASCCLQNSFDIKTLSEILGHSNIKTTMNIYLHTSMEQKIECMSRLQLL